MRWPWRLAVAVTTAVWTFSVVALDPLIQIGLQLFDRCIDLFAKRDLVELFQNRLVESLTDAVGLRALRFTLGVIDVFQREIQLVLVLVFLAAVFRSTVSQDSQQRDIMLFKERTNSPQIFGELLRMPRSRFGRLFESHHQSVDFTSSLQPIVSALANCSCVGSTLLQTASPEQ